MDIVFLIPETANQTSDFDNVISRSVEMVPLGVFYMATLLLKHGYDVEVEDLNVVRTDTEREDIINRIVDKKPKIIGLSVSTPTYPVGKELVKKLKSTLKHETIFVWGGYHVTFLPEEPFNDEIADIVVRGEGEYAMLDLAYFFLEKKGNLSSIEGISFKSNGKIVHNSPPLLRIEYLEKLPIPDRDFVPPERYTNPGTVVTSRGCVARCQFCPAGAFGPVKMNSSENVVYEIMNLHKRYGIRHISFVDNTFTAFKERTLEILGKLKETGLNLNFAFESRVSPINEMFIKNLSECNVILVQFGAETGNSKILLNINKNIKLEQVERAVELCSKYNIKVKISFVIGHPNDTRETVLDTINFAKKLVRRGALAYFSILTPFPGTDVFINREKLGVNIFNWDYTKWDCLQPVMKTRFLSAVDLKNLFKMANSEILSIC